jgi:hypothetical protein
MTVKELIYALQQFPEDREVVIWASKGYWTYDEADYISGLFEVNTLEELSAPLDRKQTGKIKLEYLESDEINSELKYRKYIEENPEKYHRSSKQGQIYIKSKKGLGNFKDYEKAQ